MTTTTVADQVERVLKPIQQFVRGWMTGPTDRSARRRSRDAVRHRSVDRRTGGACSATAMLTSPRPALRFWPPTACAPPGTRCPDGLTHRQVADAYAGCAARGARGVRPVRSSRMARLDELGRRIADAADGSIGAVFAGWRAQPQPDDVNARVALTIHVLRELRGARTSSPLQACGITPLDAVLASPAAPPRSGPVWAEHLGWTGPFRDRHGLADARLEAERLTSRILVPIYGSIGDGALDEFADADRDDAQRHRHVVTPGVKEAGSTTCRVTEMIRSGRMLRDTSRVIEPVARASPDAAVRCWATVSIGSTPVTTSAAISVRPRLWFLANARRRVKASSMSTWTRRRPCPWPVRSRFGSSVRAADGLRGLPLDGGLILDDGDAGDIGKGLGENELAVGQPAPNRQGTG